MIHQHETYNLQQRTNEFRQAVEWVHQHQHLPELMASIYIECLSREGMLWFAGSLADRWAQLFNAASLTMHQQCEGCSCWSEEPEPRDVVVSVEDNVRRPSNVTTLAFLGRKETHERFAWSRQITMPIYVDVDSQKAVEVAAHMVQLLVAEVVDSWLLKQ